MKLKIAVADDHILIRKCFSDLLALIGYEILIAAENGRELIELMDEESLPDVCILDNHMPMLNGFDASEIIKEQWPFIKTIIFSFEDSLILSKKFETSKADGYLSKLADADEVERVITNLVVSARQHPRAFSLER